MKLSYSPTIDALDDATIEKPHRAITCLSVVIPCFNEVECIERLALKLLRLEEAHANDIRWQWVLVDDGSSDGTADKIEQEFSQLNFWTIVRHSENRGLTAALQSGFAASEGEWTACLDADCTYDPEILPLLLEKARLGFDCVTASPYHAQGRVENVTAWRIALSRFASCLYRMLMRSKLSCYTCCVRIYDTQFLKRCDRIESNGFIGVTELLWKFDRSGARIGEVPAVLRPRISGVSKMRTLRTTLGHLKLLRRILLTRFNLRPS